MDPKEKREVYEVARRAVRDEVRAMIADFVAIAIGSALLVVGLLGILDTAIQGSLLSLQGGVSLFLALLGLGMVAVTWRWDRWLRGHLPTGNTTQR
ncbi:hypothetical protein [Halococcus hamelinensis]|uniref:Uncharacterized protein n=1 Tax=Halococcus hamelinensis 100A6 TaxID=1132509 RepID=M0LYI0_9EURY|nr:hypothetical protein [Halococcus hamelinensis]EMA38637.1 hypothetical protein C447_08870 [Halococcus hamelinensis 100A6]